MVYRYVEGYFHEMSMTKRIQLVEFGIHNILDKLGKMAFNDIIRDKRITKEKLFATFQCNKIEEIMYLTFGFLMQDESTKKEVYCFKERIVAEYLVAKYQYMRMLELVRDRKCLGLSSMMLECIKKLPLTSGIFGMIFSMMSGDAATKRAQKPLLRELIGRSLKFMLPCQVTLFCIEMVFESKNEGDLISMVQEFTWNDTVNLASVLIPPYKVAYTLTAIGYLVRNTEHLYGLNLAGFHLGEEECKQLTDPTNQVSDNNLQMLNLSHNPLGYAGMVALYRFLVKATTLTWLDLSHCQLGDYGVRILGDLLECMPLVHLDLSYNEVTDNGVHTLVQRLRQCLCLEHLNLGHNQLTDGSALMLSIAVKNLPRLKRLDLDHNTGITYAGRQTLHAIFREINQKRLSGTDVVQHWHTDRSKVYFSEPSSHVKGDGEAPEDQDENDDDSLERESTLKESDNNTYTPFILSAFPDSFQSLSGMDSSSQLASINSGSTLNTKKLTSLRRRSTICGGTEARILQIHRSLAKLSPLRIHGSQTSQSETGSNSSCSFQDTSFGSYSMEPYR